MNIKTFILFTLSLSLAMTSLCQTSLNVVQNYRWVNRYATPEKGLTQIAFDTITLDSIYIDRYELKRINPEGELIEHLQIETANRCNHQGYKLSGPYKTYYPSGELKQVGKLQCGLKTGEWKEFYPSGKIKKYEHFLKLEQSVPLSIQQGLYTEYHTNGQRKIKGQYQIFEKLDSLVVFDYDLYEAKDSCCQWQLHSQKVDQWIEYDSLGNVLLKKMFKVKPNGKTLRDYSEK